MAKSGRKVISGKRYVSGRLKRSSTIQQIIDRDRADEQEQMATVLAQPHRRGNTDQRLASAFGRFCVAHKLSREIYDAGENYSQKVRKWRAIWGIKMQDKTGGSPPPGEGITWDELSKLNKELANIASAMRLHGTRAMMDARNLICDHIEPMPEDASGCIQALTELMTSTTTMTRRMYPTVR